MNVCELWTDGLVRKYLSFTNMNDGKYVLRNLAKEASKKEYKKQSNPKIFTNVDE